MENLKKIVFAKFAGKVDRGGAPYIGHIHRVANRAEKIVKGSYLTGFIHDVLEDTDLTADDLYLLGVDDSVINRVSVLTRVDGVGYKNYIKKIKKYAKVNNDKIILAVKISDLNDNLNVSRLKVLQSDDFCRLKKYMEARQSLEDTLKFLNSMDGKKMKRN